jgi:hypothetical protein
MYDLAVAYLRNHYTDLGAFAWVQSAERTVASAYAANVGVTPILAMIDAGSRTVVAKLRRVLAGEEERLARYMDLLLRMRSLEGDIYCTLYTAIAGSASAPSATGWRPSSGTRSPAPSKERRRKAACSGARRPPAPRPRAVCWARRRK